MELSRPAGRLFFWRRGVGSGGSPAGLLLFGEQGRDDGRAFVFQWGVAGRLGSAAVPVAGVGCVALAAVEIGVDPGTVGGFDLLRDRVGAVPITMGVPPEGLHERSEPGRWSGCAE